jgi:anti-sigma regulatory factor (Ser/Thr protein kinase)
MDIRLHNDLAELEQLATFIASAGEKYALPPKALFQLNLALEELVTNIISYGYDDKDSHEIKVSIEREGDELTARVVDDARPFDPATAPEPDLDLPMEARPIGGLGIHLVRKMFDAMTYTRNGKYNTLVINKNLAADSCMDAV